MRVKNDRNKPCAHLVHEAGVPRRKHGLDQS